MALGEVIPVGAGFEYCCVYFGVEFGSIDSCGLVSFMIMILHVRLGKVDTLFASELSRELSMLETVYLFEFRVSM